MNTRNNLRARVGQTFLSAVLVLLLCGRSVAEPPAAVDDRLVVELVAEQPDIVTPTGVAVDERGRIWAIENQTHQRPADYKGPAGDRIRVFDDFGPDGRARRVTTFADGFKNGMGLAFGPSGALYFATRARIMILEDRDGDDVADERREIVKLDTPGDYPHNGLSGFAFDAFDNVYFGFGENLGAPYKLIGSDGTTLSGGGEGGNIYRCRPDGTKLARVATGFWNPFHLTFDAFGRLFAVDNDPDSRPPCRLLHIIPGGDYGYRFRNGRKGLHPFTAWNGELPGTLPMVAGTGEAPSGIVAYESDGLPAEYRGDLIVTSWGDHVIQRFKLAERGASFSSRAETFVRGPDNFYPVGIAIAPDGSLVVTDWADKSYPLHGKGRIWRIRTKDRPAADGIRANALAASDTPALKRLLGHARVDVRRAAAHLLSTRGKDGRAALADALQHDPEPRARVGALWSLAQSDTDLGQPRWMAATNDSNVAVSGEATRLFVETGWDRVDWDLDRPGSQLHPFVELQRLLGTRTMLNNTAARVRVARILVGSEDPFLGAAAIDVLIRCTDLEQLLPLTKASDVRTRTNAVIALRRSMWNQAQQQLPRLLEDADPDVRRAAIQWVAEERIAELEPMVHRAAAQPPVTRELFESFLAAEEMLSGIKRQPTDEPAGEDLVAKMVGDDAQPPKIRALAMRMLRPNHPTLKIDVLRGLLADEDDALRYEATRSLSLRADDASQSLLRELVAGPRTDLQRLWAIVGLGHSAASSEETRRLLIEAVRLPGVELDALRSLRGALNAESDANAIVTLWSRSEKEPANSNRRDLAESIVFALSTDARAGGKSLPDSLAAATGSRPQNENEWRAELARPGDAAAGERVFFHPRGPRCFACHRVNGRGDVAGPDLSVIGSTLDRDKIVRSILSPSSDIAPQYTPWLIATRSGQIFTGIILQDDPRGALTLADSQGRTVVVPAADIEDRRAQTRSIMPDNLIDQMTRRECRDLVEFLSNLR
jgi:putative membrane-bound dehydrogenase-like protein